MKIKNYLHLFIILSASFLFTNCSCETKQSTELQKEQIVSDGSFRDVREILPERIQEALFEEAQKESKRKCKWGNTRIFSMSPNPIKQSKHAELRIQGQDFFDGVVFFIDGKMAKQVQILSQKELKVSLDLSSFSTGEYSVYLRDCSGQKTNSETLTITK
jgi:hypothetical protein